MAGITSFLRKFLNWFQNHSLRFKMVLMLFSVVGILQIVNGFIFIYMFSEKFEENIYEANLATTRQMSLNLNRAMIDIVSEMVPIRSEMLNNQSFGNKEIVLNDYINRNITYQSLFNQLIASSENYQFVHSAIILEGDTGFEYLYTKDEYLNLNGEKIFEKIMRENELYSQCHWSRIITADYFFRNRTEELVTIIMPAYRYDQVKDLLLVNLEVEAIQKYLIKMGDNDRSLLLQMNDSDWIFEPADNLESYHAEEKEIFTKFVGWNKIEEIRNSVVMSSSLDINGWKLSMIMPKSSISDSAGVLSKAIMLVIIITGMILLLGISNIVMTVTKPIRKMTEIMEANRHTRLINYRFHALYKDEVGVLAETYNKLMDEITQLMKDIEKEQVQSRETYQRMLQMQIKPHFLYNTLEAAKFLVEMGDPNGVEMLNAIGKFYKSSLSGVEDYVTVNKEIEHLKCYLQILKLRYSSKYDYTVQISPEILDNEIVRFSMQPLVENAVYHGIKQKRGKGFVKVLGYMSEESVHLVVWDNGCGISKGKLEEIRRRICESERIPISEHIGIVNVHQRIRVRYGGAYGLNIDSEEGEFTRVELVLPIKRSAEHV